VGLGLTSYLFTLGSKGFTVLGAIITAGSCLAIAYYVFWWYWRGGNVATKACFKKREERRSLNENLPEDMVWWKKNMTRLMDHTCLPDEEEEEEGENAEVATKEIEAAPSAASDNTENLDEAQVLASA
jgi:sodium-dependent phosphate cotransporter